MSGDSKACQERVAASVVAAVYTERVAAVYTERVAASVVAAVHTVRAPDMHVRSALQLASLQLSILSPTPATSLTHVRSS
jgi:hypothetical protein